jgi:hypothetical protein
LASNAALGGDHQAGCVGEERLADEPLGNLRAVGIGGVDEGDPQFDRAAQHAVSFGGILWLAPCAFAHQAHGSVAESMNG